MKVGITEEIYESLEIRWQELVESCKVDQKVAEQCFQEITVAYNEPHRYYHNLNHLEHMFRELECCKTDSGFNVSNEMLWAVWYHDIVYKPGAKNNEKRSAEIAKNSLLELGISKENTDRVFELIMATKIHQCDSNDCEIQMFLDADMAILGSNKSTYSIYCETVRKEHSSIPGFLFNKGRKKFLASVLKQDDIFLSNYFNNKYEKIARENIQEELSNL